MITPDKFDYQTKDGRLVVLLPQTKDVNGKRVWVGLIAGEKSFRHWTEDGKLFGENDKKADLK